MTTRRTLSRRGLIGAGAGAAAAAALGTRAPAVLGSPHSHQTRSEPDAFAGPALLPDDRIGIQLYTVRDQVSNTGFAAVFAALADIGYKHVEFAGYTQGTTPEITVQHLRQLLDANGLTAIGSHLSLTPMNDAEMQQAIADAQVLGIPQIGVSLVVPTSGTTVSGWQTIADTMNHYGQLAAQQGLGFYLHNHFQEWSQCTDNPLQRGEDVLLTECDPRYVFFELDIYWAYVGQYLFGSQAPLTFDPLMDYALPHRDRYRIWHVKDGKRNQTSPQGYDIIECGQGSIDFEHFFCTVGQIDTHYFVHENDNGANHLRGSLASSQVSYLWMRHGLQGC
jgi:sugar phosphate isomerase/epimerase